MKIKIGQTDFYCCKKTAECVEWLMEHGNCIQLLSDESWKDLPRFIEECKEAIKQQKENFEMQEMCYLGIETGLS